MRSLAACVVVFAVAALPLAATEPTGETVALQKACDGRDFRACDDLARRHLYGAGAPKDPARAGALFRKACDGGYARGCAQIEAWRFAELRLAACMLRDGAGVAYLLHWNEHPWRATPGQRLLDGEIRAVGPDTVTFQSADGTTSVRKLFERAAPAPSTFDAQYNGARVSVRMEEDVATFVAVMAEVSDSNAIVANGASGIARATARNAPWDGVLGRALIDAGFASRIERGVRFVGTPDQVKRLYPPPPARTPCFAGGSRDMMVRKGVAFGMGPCSPMSLAVHRARMSDLGGLFADVSQLNVNLPTASCDAVTVYLYEMPWDEALGWVVAACGWTYHVEGNTIHVEASQQN